MKGRPVPVIAVNGFLESGKTFFLNDAIDQETFIDPVARCVLIVCEQGAQDYDPRVMRANHITLVNVNEPEELSEEFFEKLIQRYRPDLIYMEQNAMWPKEAYDFPPCVELAQQLTVINAESFAVYFNNMRQKVVDMLTNSEVVIMYNCDDEAAVTQLKRNLQLINKRLGFLYFDSQGDTVNLADDLPYSVDTDYVNVEDTDYGIFYIDSYQNPDRYNGKTCEVTIKAVLDKSIPKGYFVGGRRVMTCCANDVQFFGVVCLNQTDVDVHDGDWLRVAGDVSYKMVDDEPHMLLTIKKIKHLPPRNEDNGIGL